MRLTQNLDFPCFRQLPSFFCPLLPSAGYLTASFISPQLSLGYWDDHPFVPFFAPLSCPHPQTYVFCSCRERSNLYDFALPCLAEWESCPAVFPWEWSVASRSPAWLKEMFMFSLHQGDSTFLDCLSLKPAFYLFLSLHAQVYLSYRGGLYKVCGM